MLPKPPRPTHPSACEFCKELPEVIEKDGLWHVKCQSQGCNQTVEIKSPTRQRSVDLWNDSRGWSLEVFEDGDSESL